MRLSQAPCQLLEICRGRLAEQSATQGSRAQALLCESHIGATHAEKMHSLRDHRQVFAHLGGYFSSQQLLRFARRDAVQIDELRLHLV